MRIRAAVVLLAFCLPTSAFGQETAVVLPTRGEGVDPVVLQLLTSALRDRVQGRGYRLAEPPAASVPGASPLDAARAAARTTQATIGVAAFVSIPSLGRYQLAIWSAARAGDRSWTAQDQSSGADVLALLERILASAVPPPPEAAAAVLASAVPIAPVVPAGPPPDAQGLPPIVPNAPGGQGPAGLPPVVPNAPFVGGPPPIVDGGGPPARGNDFDDDQLDTLRVVRVRQRPIPRIMLGAVSESCIGINRGFYNHLVGPRVQIALSQSFFAFATAAYAYYQDDPGFALVGHAGIEGRVRLGERGKNGMPFRFSLGYAPNNGGFLKLDMGLSLAIGKRTDLVLIPLAPTIWFLEGGNAVSMNLAIEINTGI